MQCNTSAFQVQNNECNSNVTAIASYEIETYYFYPVSLLQLLSIIFLQH